MILGDDPCLAMSDVIKLLAGCSSDGWIISGYYVNFNNEDKKRNIGPAISIRVTVLSMSVNSHQGL